MNIEIDGPLRALILACETNCVAGCCGPDAFDLGSANVEKWAAAVSGETAARAGDQLKDLLKNLEPPRPYPFQIHVGPLEGFLERAECEKVFTEILNTLSRVLKIPE